MGIKQWTETSDAKAVTTDLSTCCERPHSTLDVCSALSKPRPVSDVSQPACALARSMSAVTSMVGATGSVDTITLEKRLSSLQHPKVVVT